MREDSEPVVFQQHALEMVLVDVNGTVIPIERRREATGLLSLAITRTVLLLEFLVLPRT